MTNTEIKRVARKVANSRSTTPEPHPETRSHQVLRARFENLTQHLEVQDAAVRHLSRALKAERDRDRTIAEALPLSGAHYTQLGHPVSHQERITSHSRSCSNEYAIIAAYTSVAEYLRSILAEMYVHRPLLVVAKAGDQSMSFHEIVKAGTFEEVGRQMVDRVFRSLENERSTRKLIDKILAKTGVVLGDAVYDRALCYLEMRHLFIHRAGVADAAFVAEYGERIALDSKNRLPTTYDVARAAIGAALELCSNIDRGLLSQGIVQPGNPNQRVACAEQPNAT